MNWDDYEAVWKRQPLPKGAEADVAELKRTFEARSRKLEAAIRVQDYAEAGAGVVASAAYAFYWWRVGASGWPMGFALGLILGVSTLFIRNRFRARRRRVKLEASLLTKVEADIAELRHQAQLVKRLWFYYLGPIAGAMAIHYGVILRHTAPWSPLREPWFIAGTILFMSVVLWFAWWINQRALRQRLRPRLAELEKLRGELLAESPTPVSSRH